MASAPTRAGGSARSHAGTILVTAHVNPSAACTLVLDPGLALRAVLAGWPVATLPDGRVVYQRNQIHFAAVHPLALGLFDPARLSDTPLHPRKPYQAARAAHAARMRQVYTEAWCAARNHPCDPDVFDERLASDVLVDDRGEALAFVVAFDNTTGWSDAERWGRLEAFRELRVALSRWDGRGEPSGALGRSLVAGLNRARNLGAGPHVATALSDDPDLRDLIGGVLASLPAEGVDPARWLLTLDGRWGGRRDLAPARARLIAAPDEITEAVYVYAAFGAGTGSGTASCPGASSRRVSTGERCERPRAGCPAQAFRDPARMTAYGHRRLERRLWQWPDASVDRRARSRRR